MKLRHFLGLDGEPITQDGCNCDIDYRCADARCQMEQDLEMRAALAEFNQRRVRPFQQSYAEEMIDAGRGHLLTIDERCDYLMSQR